MEQNEEGMVLNREILKCLIKGKGPEEIDEQDNVNGSTPLMVACENLKDIEIVKLLLDGGADINAVNNDMKLPMSLIEARMEMDPRDEGVKKIY